jgi:hypothetical protein
MSTRILLGIKTAVHKADNLPPSSADVTESGSLNLPETSGSHRPVREILFPHLLFEILFYVLEKNYLTWQKVKQSHYRP